MLGYSSNHIDILVQDEGFSEWRFTGYHGYPERQRIREAWAFIRLLHSISSLPWCVAGDFNDMLSPDDKTGRIPHPEWLLQGFKEVI